MNILALDYGTKRIGMAWIDTDLGVVLPFGIAANIDEVVETTVSEKADRVVVGLPMGLDGTEKENTTRVKEFIAELESKIDASVVPVDERFSSQQADRMGDGGVSRDERSAMVILQSYLDTNPNL